MTKHVYEGELLGFNQNLYLDDTAQTLFALIADKIAPTITSDGMGPDCHHFGRVRITVEQLEENK